MKLECARKLKLWFIECDLRQYMHSQIKNIGGTKRRLDDRFTENLRSININSPGLPVAAHFNSSKLSIFKANVYVDTSCVNATYRKTKQERLIYILETLKPRGMKLRFHSFPDSIVAPS